MLRDQGATERTILVPLWDPNRRSMLLEAVRGTYLGNLSETLPYG